MRRNFSKRNTKRSKSKSITIFQKQFFQGLVFLIGLSLVIIFAFYFVEDQKLVARWGEQAGARGT